jgi:hypothetical protein
MDVGCTCSGMVFSLKKESNSDMSYNIGELSGHYVR